jgi:hypothetical protein
MANSLASGALGGALSEGTISNWRFDTGLTLRLTFRAPKLTIGPRRNFFWLL